MTDAERPAALASGAALPQRVVDATIVLYAASASIFLFAQLYRRSAQVGFDFRANIWTTAARLLSGAPYYPNSIGKAVPTSVSAYPPLLGFVGVAFRPLGPHLALVTWDVVGAAAFAGALWCVRVRDWRVYCLAFGSLPFVAATVLGQVSPILALGTALAWRHRDRRYAPGLIAAALIAVKLLAWPMLLWLVLTRRLRAAAAGAVATVVLLLAPWAAISFEGLQSYPRLLIRSGESWGAETHSVYSLALAAGGSSRIADASTLLCLLLAIVCMWLFARRGADLSTFALATAAGIYASPVVHPHYLLALLIVLAIIHPRFSYAWIFVIMLWVSPQEPPLSTGRLAFAVCSGLALATYVSFVSYRRQFTQTSITPQALISLDA